MHRVLLERRIRDVHTRLVRAREELAVLNEQLAVVQESADEARVRALVSETPLASQEHNEAARHADAMVRARDALDKSIVDLERRQDELLAAVASGKQWRTPAARARSPAW